MSVEEHVRQNRMLPRYTDSMKHDEYGPVVLKPAFAWRFLFERFR